MVIYPGGLGEAQVAGAFGGSQDQELGDAQGARDVDKVLQLVALGLLLGSYKFKGLILKLVLSFRFVPETGTPPEGPRISESQSHSKTCLDWI